MRVLVGRISNSFHDVGAFGLPRAVSPYSIQAITYAGEPLARALRQQRSNGLVYPSVRTSERTLHCGFLARCCRPPDARNATWNTNGMARKSHATSTIA